MAFNVISEITIDMASPTVNIVNAVQFDSSGRVVKIHLRNNGEAWAVPSNVYPVIRYQKSDRIGGFYDIDENNAYAISYEDNRTTVNITLALQALTTAGNVSMQVNFYNANAQRVTSFAFRLKVQASSIPDSEIISSEYYNALTKTLAEVVKVGSLSDYMVRAEAAAIAAEQAASNAEAEVMQTVPTLVSDWLIANMHNPSNPALDKSLSVDGAAADALATGNVKNTVFNSFIKEENPTNIIDGRYIANDGTVTQNAGWCVTRFIPIYNGIFAVRGNIDTLGNNGKNVAFYNKNQQFISGVNVSFSDYLVWPTVPENAVFACVSTQLANKNKFYVATVRQNFSGLYHTEVVDREYITKQFDLNKSRNLINPNTITNDYYVYYLDGIVGPSAGYAVTDFIPVSEGENYTFTVYEDTGNEYNVLQCAFYDINKKYVTGLLNENIKNTLYFTVPANAFYVRWTLKNRYTKVQLEKGTQTSFIRYSSYKLNQPFVTVGPNGNYASLLRALIETPSYIPIHLLSGEYDIVQEYKDYYGSDYWDNYTGYSGNANPFSRGLWIDAGRKIIGIGNPIIKFEYTGSNNAVSQYFSVISNGSNTEVDGVTIKYRNVRYAVHDDFGPSGSTIIWRNIIFDGSSGSAIGGGLGANCRYLIEGCIFLNNNGTYDINYHGSTSVITNNRCRIEVKNCYGRKRVKFGWYGVSTTVSDCLVHNSKFDALECSAHTSGQPNVNMRLISWCNETNS